MAQNTKKDKNILLGKMPDQYFIDQDVRVSQQPDIGSTLELLISAQYGFESAHSCNNLEACAIMNCYHYFNFSFHIKSMLIRCSYSSEVLG